MTRNKAIPILLWMAVVALMAVIFAFSAQPASESSETSSPFVDAYMRLFHPEADSLSPDEQFELREQASFIVRKAAHFSIYTLLGLLLAAAVSAAFPAARAATWAGRLWLPFLIGALWAVSDEIHQHFVPGRSCEIRDMGIDSSGVLLGVLLFTAAARLAARLRTRRTPE